MKHVHRIKRCASLCLVTLLAAVLCLGAFAAEAPRFVVTSSASQVSWGEEFTVEVSIANNPASGICAASFTLDYDPEKFEYKRVEKSRNGVMYNEMTGSFIWTGDVKSPVTDSTISLVTVVFCAKEKTPVGVFPISITDGKMGTVVLDADGTTSHNTPYTDFAAPTSGTVTTVPATDHVHSGEWKESDGGAATCTKAAQQERTCPDCGIKETRENGKPLGHNWDEGKVTKQPTTDAEGVRTYTCTVDGATCTEAIPKLAPTPAPTPAPVSPRTTKQGTGTLGATKQDAGTQGVDTPNIGTQSVDAQNTDTGHGLVWALLLPVLLCGAGVLAWRKRQNDKEELS